MINHLMITLFMASIIRPHLNPKGPIHVRYALECLTEIATKQFKRVSIQDEEIQNTALLTILTSNNMKSPAFEVQQKLVKELHNSMEFNIEVIDSEAETGNRKVEMVTNFCVMVVDSFSTLDLRLETMPTLKTFNQRASFLVYYSKVQKRSRVTASIILKRFWEKFIYNVVVLLPKNLEEFELYTMNFNTKDKHLCLGHSRVALLGTCTKGTFGSSRYVFKKGTLKNFDHCTINVVANEMDPFVLDENHGFEIEFIKEIGRKLNIFFDVTLSGQASWGVKNESDGIWSYGLGLVQQESFLGVGNFYATPEYEDDFEFTTPHFDDNLIWVVPIADYVPEWRVLTIIFSWYLWLLCIGVIIVGALLLRICFSKKEYKPFKNFGFDLCVSFQVVVVQAVAKHPKSDWTRVVFVALAIFSIVISSVYTSQLIQVLTRSQRERQVDTLEGVFEQNWDIGGLPVDGQIFKYSDDEMSKRIDDIFQINDSLNIWLTSVADDRDTCTPFSEFFIKYRLAKGDPFVTDGNGKPKVYILDEIIFPYSLYIVTNKGFPFLDRIDYVIGWMNSFGLVKGISNKYTFILGKVKEIQEEESYVQQLSLEHLQGAFAILIIGSGVGFAILFFEHLVYCVAKKVRQRQREKVLRNAKMKYKKNDRKNIVLKNKNRRKQRVFKRQSTTFCNTLIENAKFKTTRNKK